MKCTCIFNCSWDVALFVMIPGHDLHQLREKNAKLQDIVDEPHLLLVGRSQTPMLHNAVA